MFSLPSNINDLDLLSPILGFELSMFNESRGGICVYSLSKYNDLNDSIDEVGFILRGGMLVSLLPKSASQSTPRQKSCSLISLKPDLAPSLFSGSLLRRPYSNLIASLLK